MFAAFATLLKKDVEKDIVQEPPSSCFWQENEAVVDKTIRPGRSGRVYYKGSYWPARCQRNITISSGQMVRVLASHNITLVVEPIYV